MRFSTYILAAGALVLAACSESLSVIPWTDTPIEATLFSASRDVYVGKPSALDFVATPVRTVAIESEAAAGSWDVVLVDNGNGLAIESPVTFEGVSSTARIATISNTAYESVKTAPKDSINYSAGPVPLELGKVYVIKSRVAPCALTSGALYAKIKPVEIDVPNGKFRFTYVANPNCGDRSLDAPED